MNLRDFVGFLGVAVHRCRLARRRWTTGAVWRGPSLSAGLIGIVWRAQRKTMLALSSTNFENFKVESRKWKLANPYRERLVKLKGLA